MVEDSGLRDVIRLASSDPAYTLPWRGTIVARVEELYETEKQSKINLLQNANAVSLTGDHWTSVSNQNDLGVTAHHIDADWKLENVLAKCRKLVRHFKHSPANAAELRAQQDELGQPQEPLVQDVSTRWNSTLSMITRLLRKKGAVKATLELHQQRGTPAMLTNAELEKIEKLETLLEPCR